MAGTRSVFQPSSTKDEKSVEIILVTGSAAGCEVTGEAEVQEERLSRQRLRQLLELLFKISD
jgi:hypothetical protein